MSFFATDAAPEPEEERTPYRRQHRVFGPSPDEVGRPVAESFVLVRTELVAVAVQAIRAYRDGCLLEVDWILRRTDEDAATWRAIHDSAFHVGGLRNRDADALLFGVVLADGAIARTNDRFDRRDPGDAPRLVFCSGSGTDGGTERIHGQHQIWLTPLPPGPTMELVCAWPRFGVTEHRRRIDASAVREAASHARSVWPDDAALPTQE